MRAILMSCCPAALQPSGAQDDRSLPLHRSYLLRIRLPAEGETLTWCAYLQDLTTGRRLGFATLDALFAFLERVSAAPQGKEDTDRDTE